MTKYDLSYRGPFADDCYEGLWRVPGDEGWRDCLDCMGKPIRERDPDYAKLNAALRLIGYLNAKLPADYPPMTDEEKADMKWNSQ